MFDHPAVDGVVVGREDAILADDPVVVILWFVVAGARFVGCDR
jgi:hypothetical protein